MRDQAYWRSTRSWVCRGFAKAAALALVPGVVLAATPPRGDAARNYDARVELNRSFKAAPSPTQLQAVADLRKDIRDLGVTYNDETGATRSILNYVGFLTAPAPAGTKPEAIGLQFVRNNLGLFGLNEEDLADYETTDTVFSAVSGATYVYLRQRHAGLPLYNGQLHFGIAKGGRILVVNNAFLPGLASAVNATSPEMGAADAVLSAARHIGVDGATPAVRSEAKGAQHETMLDAAGISAEPVQAKLMLLPIRQGEARLVWNFQIHTLDSQHVYDMNVDAVDGKVWTRIDWVAADTYRAYEEPAESPNHVRPPLPLPPADGRVNLVNPAHLVASPFGWHDTNGAAGAEFTTTQGNNVHAYTDTDANDTPDPGSSPDGGATLVFNFPIDLTQPPSAYRPAAVTNLFYWNNLIHDVQHRYGFDAPGGNFQVNNYGAGGLGNDDVRAEAQDGSGTNNANFLTLPDGQRPRMQMFIGTNPTPDVDGDLDNGVIVHEYGHGISNRLIGGPANVSCLTNAQRPSEGLSDWWALFYTAEVGDTGPDSRGIGTYLFGQPATGPGIRPFPYSTNNAVNPDTYASVAGRAVPHGVGAVWAQGYWEVYWRLVDQYGFDIDIHNATGGAGNQRANLYINEGLKATICNPAFTDVRDGIIAAATAINGGADVCRLWAGFAAYGLGINAISGGPNGLTPTNGFLLPVPCRPQGPAGLVATANGANRISLTWTASPGAASYRVYRANGACPQPSYNQIAQNITATNYDDTTVSGGNTYSYVVTAVDGNGVESGFSNCDDAVATGGCSTPPTFGGATSVTQPTPGSCRLDVNWAAGTTGCPGTTLTYNVYRSTDPVFTPSPANLRQSCVNALTFADTTVASGSTYYYIVRAEDSTTGGTGACNSGNQDANLVRQSGNPDVIAAFSDDIEGGTANWVLDSPGAGNPWAVVTTASHSPTRSWFTDDPDIIKDKRVAFAANVNITAGSTLSFWHRINAEIHSLCTPNQICDGGVLEYSTNGGTTWFDILAGNGGTIPANPARITAGAYTGTISTAFQNPLGGRLGWGSDNTAFAQVMVNLADFAGNPVRFRWRFASDDSVADQGWWVDDVVVSRQQACTPAQAVAPFALTVDAGGNGVLQPDESAVVAPEWRNTGGASIALTGAASNFTGPSGPVYTIDDAAASYGTIGVGASASCSTGGDCYAVTVTGSRPQSHWDSTIDETVSPTSATKTWTLHVGDSFTDVTGGAFYRFIETIFHKGITGGCAADRYCPTNPTTREQMAAFVLVAKEGAGYNPPACTTPMFTDVPASSPFCKFIEELARRGVTGGCNPGLYCPQNPVTRAQMSVFVLRTLDPNLDPPACTTPIFQDVPASDPFCRWIEELVRRQVVTGCAPSLYCPNDAVTREQMGVFLTVTFSLTLYGL